MSKSTHHSFDTELASEYGVHGAIIIHHFQHWINHNKQLGRNFIDGRTWSYQTQKEIAAWFPYMTTKQVRTTIDNLVAKGVLRKGNYNKGSFDKTLWYSFENEEMFTIAQMGNGCAQMGTPIPDTIPNTKNMSVAEAPIGAPPVSIFVIGKDGKSFVLDQTQLYPRMIAEKRDWTGEEIAYAWKALESQKGIVNDWWAFIEGTIRNLRSSAKSKRASGEKVPPRVCTPAFAEFLLKALKMFEKKKSDLEKNYIFDLDREKGKITIGLREDPSVLYFSKRDFDEEYARDVIINNLRKTGVTR
jgi:hypothetical protein